ncbi:MAG: hypothetical protein CMI01_14500 [Oceanospirillaceae bacterium]|nr:hypothetical protein [Oceanospirillaceae bacterium]
MNANATSNLSLSARDDLSGYLLTGPASAEALAGSGLPQPQSQLTALEMTGALVARTGKDEYMAFLPAGQQLSGCEWCFPRNDRILVVQGEGWIELMLQLCQFDFRKMQPGDWLMASVAGVNCWLYREQQSGALMIGFDAGYDHYLSEIFSTLVRELGGKDSTKGGAL